MQRHKNSVDSFLLHHTISVTYSKLPQDIVLDSIIKVQLVDRRAGVERRRNINNPLAGFLPIVTARGLIFSDRRVIADRRMPVPEQAAETPDSSVS
jgi:hypothetical protein